MDWKGKIKQDVKNRQKEKPPGVFLNNSETTFTHDARMPEEQRQTAYELYKTFGITGYKEKQKLLDFDILLANLLRKRGAPVVVSYAWKDWKTSPYTRASYFVTDLIEIMENNGLIGVKTGIYTEKIKRKTRIWPTKLLLDQFPQYYSGVYIDPVNLVVLRDENKKPIPYTDTAFTRKVRSILTLANSVNKQALMTYQGYRLYNPLTAIFNRKFTMYGRLHTRGHRKHFQSWSEKKRTGLKINGESVVELDYSGLHPRLLYAKEGIQFNDDPYTIVHDDPRTRPFMKKILLFMLNSKDMTTANKAGNYWLYQNRQERRTLKSIGITKAAPIIELFMNAHKPISHFLCKGKTNGLRIMNLDAKIALDVVHHFAKQGIPILPVHDSFVVQARYKDELYQVMDETYQKHTKGFRCPVK